MMNRVILTLLIFVSVLANAQATNKKYYCDDLDLGWNFYCDPKIEKEAPTKSEQGKSTVTKSDSSQEDDPVKQLEKIQKTLEFLKAKAVIDPTPQNISEYLSYQKEQLNRASSFADQYQRVTWQNPELNYLLERPVGHISKKNWEAERRASIQKALQEDISKNYGLFFFFRSDCSYCHAYAPILKRFADNNNLKVIPVSLDGKGIKEFPEFRTDTGQAIKLGVSVTPTTILFNKKQGQIVVIGHGVLTEDQLAERMYLLTQVEVGNDF